MLLFHQILIYNFKGLNCPLFYIMNLLLQISFIVNYQLKIHLLFNLRFYKTNILCFIDLHTNITINIKMLINIHKLRFLFINGQIYVLFFMYSLNCLL